MKTKYLLLLMMAMLYFAAVTQAIAPVPTIYLDPSAKEVEHGEIFDVTLRVDTVTDMFMWVVDIEWKPAELELQGDPVEGGCLKSYGNATTFMYTKKTGKLEGLVCTRQGDAPGADVPPSPDDLANITFKVLCDQVCTYMAVNITFAEILNDDTITPGYNTPSGLYHVIPELEFTALGLVAMFTAFGVYGYRRKNH